MTGRSPRLPGAPAGAALLLALACLALLVSAETSAEEILFSPSRQVYAEGGGLVAVADMNFDEVPDVVTTTGRDGEISVLLGAGDGTFGPAIKSPIASSGVSGLLVGDLIWNTIPDVILIGESGIEVLEGYSGYLTSRFFYDDWSMKGEPVVGDFNSDQNRDVVCVLDEPPFNGILLYQGRLDGSLWVPIHLLPGKRLDAVAAADMNGDQKLDLVASGGGQGTFVLLGRGDGTFEPAIEHPDGYEWLGIADLDGDDAPDVVGWYGHSLYMLPGLGGGILGPPVSLNLTDADISAIAIADFNRDTFPDIAAPTYRDWCEGDYGSTVEIALGLREGGFSTHLGGFTGMHPTDIAVADLDGDEALDLVIANYWRGFSVLLGDGEGQFAYEEVVRIEGHSCGRPTVAAADLYGDSRSEIAIYGEYGVLEVIGDRVSTVGVPGYGSELGLCLADFNADRIGDIAASVCPWGESPCSVTIYLGLGEGDFAFSEEYDISGSNAAVGDVTGDGILDLVLAGWQDHGQTPVAVMLLVGTGDGRFTPQDPALGPAAGVGLADLDADGVSDLALARVEGDAVSLSILLARGGGLFEPHGDYDLQGRDPVTAIQFGDLNGDRIDDIVTSTGAVLLGTGGGLFAQPTYTSGASVIADLNGDGLPDLAGASGGGVGVQIGRGDGTFAPAHIGYGAGDAIGGLAAGDFDGDGITDLVAGCLKSESNYAAILHGRFRSPNAVELASFLADPVAEGVLVTWSTAFESDHAGFHVHRSPRRDGERRRLTTSLIAPGGPYCFLDPSPPANAESFYWLEAIDLRGDTEWFGPAAASWTAPARESRLIASGPNPFRADRGPAEIRFELAAAADARLRVFDISGRLVRVLLDRPLAAGEHVVTWDGIDARGVKAGSGVYFYRLEAGALTASRSQLLLR